MRYTDDRETHVIFWVLLLFLSSWLATELYEYYGRREYQQEVREFMHRGERFTAQDGAALEERIERLERRISQED